jgi:hypothetical protein
MPEYYTMRACFDICGDNDIPFVEGLYNDEHTLTKKIAIDHHHSPSIEAALSDKWQIKRAEPVVLSADEYLKKNYNVNTDGDLILLPHHFIDVFNSADKNGQLREWLRPEQVELRCIVAIMLNKWSKTTFSIEDKVELLRIFGNLKPPYETKS